MPCSLIPKSRPDYREAQFPSLLVVAHCSAPATPTRATVGARYLHCCVISCIVIAVTSAQMKISVDSCRADQAGKETVVALALDG
jgi:hypothetical protein